MTSIIKSIFLDSIQSVLYFPFWWYTSGLKRRFLWFIRSTKGLAHNLALGIMFKYLFKPMFGQSTKSGRIISFFMRLILLCWRIFLFLLGTFFKLFLLIGWIILPIIVVIQIIILF